MIKPIRRRPGSVKADPGPKIALANRIEGIDTYENRLIFKYATVRLLIQALDFSKPVQRTQKYIRRLARSLPCGHILGLNNNGVYERTKPCMQVKLCQACMHARSHEHRKHILAGWHWSTRPRVFHWVLTTPVCRNASEELRNVSFVKKAKSCVVRKLAREKDRQGCKLEYVLGLHTKPQDQSDWQSAHLHLVVLAEPQIDCRSLNNVVTYDWQQRTQSAFGRESIVETDFCGAKLTTATTPDEGCISETHLDNLIAYAQRTSEDEDTPSSIAHRARLFDLAEIVRSYSTSKSDEARPRASRNIHFPPDALNKNGILYFPLAGGMNEVFEAVSQYRKLKKRLEDESLAIVQKYVRQALGRQQATGGKHVS